MWSAKCELAAYRREVGIMLLSRDGFAFIGRHIQFRGVAG